MMQSAKQLFYVRYNKHNGREMCNAYTLFTAEQTATMGRYASEHGKAAADATKLQSYEFVWKPDFHNSINFSHTHTIIALGYVGTLASLDHQQIASF